MSLRGRKNLPVGSSISSSAGAPAIRDDTASPSRMDALNARSLARADRAPHPRRHRCRAATTSVACTLAGLTVIAEEIAG